VRKISQRERDDTWNFGRLSYASQLHNAFACEPLLPHRVDTQQVPVVWMLMVYIGSGSGSGGGSGGGGRRPGQHQEVVESHVESR
jgi:hypothetical protein